MTTRPKKDVPRYCTLPKFERADQPDPTLVLLAPELDKRLWQWRQNPEEKPKPLVLYEQGPEVIPRFVSLTHNDVMYLAFLEDSRVFSGAAF